MTSSMPSDNAFHWSCKTIGVKPLPDELAVLFLETVAALHKTKDMPILKVVVASLPPVACVAIQDGKLVVMTVDGLKGTMDPNIPTVILELVHEGTFTAGGLPEPIAAKWRILEQELQRKYPTETPWIQCADEYKDGEFRWIVGVADPQVSAFIEACGQTLHDRNDMAPTLDGGESAVGGLALFCFEEDATGGKVRLRDLKLTDLNLQAACLVPFDVTLSWKVTTDRIEEEDVRLVRILAENCPKVTKQNVDRGARFAEKVLLLTLRGP